MLQLFDIFNRYEIPSLTLYNPNGQKLFNLGQAKNIELTLNFNSMSELKFNIDKKVDGITFENYPYISSRRIVEVENVGRFIITGVSISNNGLIESKSVSCVSLEYELVGKRLNNFEGTYKFYDIFDNSNTFLGKMLSYLPNWSVGEVDPELRNTFRTFEVTEGSIYNILMDEAEKAYECIFLFDTFNRKISAKTVEKATKKTDIFLSYNNLVKSIEVTENQEELATALSVMGSGDLDITMVNPLGTSVIYDFSYYKKLEWMEQELIDAINAWENKISTGQESYAILLTVLKVKTTELLDLGTQLTELRTHYDEIEGVKKVRIEQGISDLSELSVLLSNKMVEINTKIAQIIVKRNEITLVNSQLATVHNGLTFESNFTPKQLGELDTYIYTANYQDEYITFSEDDTYEQKQETIQELYNKAKRALVSIAQLRYTFSLSTINFIFLSEFEKYTKQLELGSQLKVDMDEGLFSYPILLSIGLRYDSPKDLKLTFGTKLRLSSQEARYDELFSETVKTSNTVKHDSKSWGEYKKKDKGKIEEFITGALNASVNTLISSDKEEIKINENGLRGREKLADGTYAPEQCWLTGKVLAFSDDSFDSAKVALGEIEYNGEKYYGLVADTIVGRILAGQQLVIENESGSFKVDGNTVTIKNGNIIMTNDEGIDENFMDAINGTISEMSDTMVTTFSQTSMPTTGKNGDLWINTTGGLNVLYRHNGTTFTIARDTGITTAINNASTAQGTANTAISNASTAQATINSVLTGGRLDTSKMTGQILTGSNNIYCVNSANTKALLINDTGILISNSKTNGNWNWSTAISGDGVVANAVVANMSITSPIINGGVMKLGATSGAGMRLHLGGSEVFRATLHNSSGAETSRLADLTFHNDGGQFSLWKGGIESFKLYAGNQNGNKHCQLQLGGGMVDGQLRIFGNGIEFFKMGSYAQCYFEVADFTVLGNFRASGGTKSALVDTENYGRRLLYCEESDRVYFNTKGIIDTSETHIIKINEIFLETIEPNSVYPYVINITPYAEAKVWVKAVYDKYIVIGSDVPCRVAYNLQCMRKGYKDIWLEEDMNERRANLEAERVTNLESSKETTEVEEVSRYMR